MEDLISLILEYGAKIISPESIIAQARKVKMSREQKEVSTEKAKMLKPGDLILQKTPQLAYDIFRQLGNHQFDHIAVVVDDQRSLHISYPKAKLVPTILFTDKQKFPLIIRPNFSVEEREAFVLNMQQQVGKSYDYKRVIYHFINSSFMEVIKEVETPNKIICSNQIFQSLLAVAPQLREAVNQMKDLEYHKYGTFTIEDFRKLAQGNRDKFQIFKLYKKDGDEGDYPKFFSLENLIQYVPPDKVVPLFKVYKMIQRYKFLQQIGKTSTTLAGYLSFLKKQIIILLTLYKMQQLLLQALKEYRDFAQYDPKNESKMSIYKSLIQNVTSLITLFESKGPLDTKKLMVPLTKLLLLTRVGSSSSIKTKALRMAGFFSSMSNQVKSRFNL